MRLLLLEKNGFLSVTVIKHDENFMSSFLLFRRRSAQKGLDWACNSSVVIA